jgi:hypothetical protein
VLHRCIVLTHVTSCQAIGDGAKIELSLSTTDKSKMESHIRRGMRAGNTAGLRSMPKGGQIGRIPIAPVVHKFPPPGPPKEPELKSRTSSSITFTWQPPSNWGGCALIRCEPLQRILSHLCILHGCRCGYEIHPR